MVSQSDIGRRVRYPVKVPKGLTGLTETHIRTGKLVSVTEKAAVIEEIVDSPVLYKLTRSIHPAHVNA